LSIFQGLAKNSPPLILKIGLATQALAAQAKSGAIEKSLPADLQAADLIQGWRLVSSSPPPVRSFGGGRHD